MHGWPEVLICIVIAGTVNLQLHRHTVVHQCIKLISQLRTGSSCGLFHLPSHSHALVHPQSYTNVLTPPPPHPPHRVHPPIIHERVHNGVYVLLPEVHLGEGLML